MKKLFAVILAVALMATMSVTAFAADYDTAGDKGVTVTYSVAPTYTVTIPTDVTIDGNATTISAENVVVEKGKYVSVSLRNSSLPQMLFWHIILASYLPQQLLARR